MSLLHSALPLHALPGEPSQVRHGCVSCVSVCVCKRALLCHLCTILFTFCLPYLFVTQPCCVFLSCAYLLSLLLCSNVFSSIKHEPRVPVTATVTRAHIHAAFVLSQSMEVEEASTACPVFTNSSSVLSCEAYLQIYDTATAGLGYFQIQVHLNSEWSVVM